MLSFCSSQMVLLLLLLRGTNKNYAQPGEEDTRVHSYVGLVFTNLTSSPCLSDHSWFLPADCGQPEARHISPLTGWQEADEGEWPWTVSIRRNRLHVCGGSLILSQWVVTAAHCFDRPLNVPEYRINLGEYELPAPTAAMISTNVSKIVAHPFYAGVGLSADIALVRLANAVDFSRMISPACLPNTVQPFVFYEGLLCWGVPFEGVSLQKVEVRIVETEECDGIYHNISSDQAIPKDYRFIHDDMICAGYSQAGKYACFRVMESLSPFLAWFLVGVSMAFGCMESSRPGIYTRVTSFMDWIEGTTYEKSAATDGHVSLATLLILLLLLALTNVLL